MVVDIRATIYVNPIPSAPDRMSITLFGRRVVVMTGRQRGRQTYAPHEYQSYLLRLWRTGTDPSASWRASLEDTRTGQWHSFASLSAAFRFLDMQTEQAVASQEGGPDQPEHIVER